MHKPLYIEVTKYPNRIIIFLLIFILGFVQAGKSNNVQASEANIGKEDFTDDDLKAGFILLSSVPCIVVSVANVNAIKDEGSYFWGSAGILSGIPLTIGGLWMLTALEEDSRILGIPVSIVGVLTTAAGIKSFHRALSYDKESETGLVFNPIIIPEKKGPVGFGIQVSMRL